MMRSVVRWLLSFDTCCFFVFLVAHCLWCVVVVCCSLYVVSCSLLCGLRCVVLCVWCRLSLLVVRCSSCVVCRLVFVVNCWMSSVARCVSLVVFVVFCLFDE